MVPTLQIGKTIEIVAFFCYFWRNASSLRSKLWWTFRIIFNCIVWSKWLLSPVHFQWNWIDWNGHDRRAKTEWIDEKRNEHEIPNQFTTKECGAQFDAEKWHRFFFVISMGIVLFSRDEIRNWDQLSGWSGVFSGLRSTGRKVEDRRGCLLSLCLVKICLKIGKRQRKKRSKSTECCPICIYILCKLFRPSPTQTQAYNHSNAWNACSSHWPSERWACETTIVRCFCNVETSATTTNEWTN